MDFWKISALVHTMYCTRALTFQNLYQEHTVYIVVGRSFCRLCTRNAAFCQDCRYRGKRDLVRLTLRTLYQECSA